MVIYLAGTEGGTEQNGYLRGSVHAGAVHFLLSFHTARPLDDQVAYLNAAALDPSRDHLPGSQQRQLQQP